LIKKNYVLKTYINSITFFISRNKCPRSLVKKPRDAASSPKFEECLNFLQCIIFFWGLTTWNREFRAALRNPLNYDVIKISSRGVFWEQSILFFFFSPRNRASWVCLSTWYFSWYQLFSVFCIFHGYTVPNLFTDNSREYVVDISFARRALFTLSILFVKKHNAASMKLNNLNNTVLRLLHQSLNNHW